MTRATALSATSTPSHYSTGSPAPGPSAPASATPSPTSPPPAKPNNADGDLDWNTFFRLRRVRRWHNLIASVFTSSGSTVVAVGILSQFDIDTFGNQVFGLDPILFMGLLTVSSGAFGWLAGPSLGNVLFGLRHKRHKAQLDLVSKLHGDLLWNSSKTLLFMIRHFELPRTPMLNRCSSVLLEREGALRSDQTLPG